VARLKRRVKLRELEELLEGKAAVAAAGNGKGDAVVITYTEDALEELHGLVGVLGAVAAKLARDGMPAWKVARIALYAAKRWNDVVEVSVPPR
jgi:hypothetical protein